MFFKLSHVTGIYLNQ